MGIWEDAAQAIHTAFAEDGLATYSPAAGGSFQVPAVRGERDLQNGGRGTMFEFRASDLPAAPTKADRFTIGGRKWRVIEVPQLNAAGGWELGCADDGAAA